MNLTLVDTDILIDLSLDDARAVQVLKRLEQQSMLAINLITVMELIVGCRNKNELRNTDRLLERFKIFPLNEQVSITAVALIRKYRLSHGLLLADAMIAATALSMDCDFISKNQRD
ncbi:MAG: twitching motility protein PilT, partial [Chloroflexi bacterium RIFOXYC12_FULL_59_14]